MAQHYFSKYFSRKMIFLVKNNSKYNFVPHGRQTFLIARKSVVIFPKNFMQENALYPHSATTFQKKIIVDKM